MSIPPGSQSRSRVLAALVLVQILFGIHYLAAKLLLETIPPRAWAVLRVSGAAVLLLALARLTGRRFPSRRDGLRLAGLSVFGVVINQVCFVEGLYRTTPGHSSILMTAIPVGALLFAVLLRQESLTAGKLLSLLLSLLGVLAVILSASGVQSTLGGLLARDTRLGDLLTLANALSYALFLVLSRRLIRRNDPLAATAVLMAWGALGVLAVGGPELAGLSPSEVPPAVWGLGGFIIVFPTALAYLLMYWALQRETSFVVALFIYLQPLIATALSMVLLGERPGPPVFGGALLIFVGVYLAVRPVPRVGPREAPGRS